MHLKIQKGHTLEEYNKKYGRALAKGRLLKIDPKNPAESHLFSSKRQYWEINENGKAMIYEVPSRRQIFARFNAAKPSTKVLITLTACLAIGGAAAATTLHFIAPRYTELTTSEAAKWIKEHYKEEKTRTTTEQTVSWDYTKNFGGSKKTPNDDDWGEFKNKDINYFTQRTLSNVFSGDIASSCFKVKQDTKTVQGGDVGYIKYIGEEIVNETLTPKFFNQIIKELGEKDVKCGYQGNDFYFSCEIVDTMYASSDYLYITAYYNSTYTFHYDMDGFLKEFTLNLYAKNLEVKITDYYIFNDSELLGLLDASFVQAPTAFKESK